MEILLPGSCKELPLAAACTQSRLQRAARAKVKKILREPEILAMGGFMGVGWVRALSQLEGARAGLPHLWEGGTTSGAVGAWRSTQLQGFAQLGPVFLLLRLLRKSWGLGMTAAIPGFASMPGGFVRDKAPRHSFFSVTGLYPERQPLLKCFLQQHCCLLPFPVVRKEGDETSPFVRLSWMGVTNLRTRRKRCKQPQVWLLRFCPA